VESVCRDFIALS